MILALYIIIAMISVQFLLYGCDLNDNSVICSSAQLIEIYLVELFPKASLVTYCIIKAN